MFRTGVKRETDEEVDFGDFKIFDDTSNVYSSTNFVFEDIQFDRMVELTKFNALFCMDTIKEELAKVVKTKKDNIAKRQLGMTDMVELLSRVKSLRGSKRGRELKLNIAPDRELRLLNMLKKQDLQNSPDSSDVSEYSDALEYQTDALEYRTDAE